MPIGKSWGEPHLQTFDGARYDLQAAGEFVAARSAADDLEVQLRMEPWGGSDRVSVTTGVAARIAGDRVSIVLGPPPVVRLNGVPVRVERATQRELAGGGRIVAGERLYVLVWPDESTLTVELRGGTYLNAYLTPVWARQGALRGLFGDFDGDPGNDFVTADGERLERPLVLETLYGKLAASWRVRQEESLFDYEPGQSTATFTDPSFPAALATIAALPEEDRRRAERVCREAGVTDPGILEACILDVGYTGDEAFALAAASAQVTDGVPLAGARPVTATAGPGPEPILSGLCRPGAAAEPAASYRADAAHTGRFRRATARLQGERRWSAPGFSAGHHPLVVGDRVIAARTDRRLAALDAETGRAVWEVGGTDERLAGAGLLAAGGAVFAGWTEHLAAYELASGAECWRLPVGGASSAAFAGGRLYVSVPGKVEDPFGYVAAVEAASGRIVWRHDARHPLLSSGAQNPSAPTVGGGAVFVADGQEMLSLDAESGQLRWRVATGAAVTDAVAYADGVVYVATLWSHGLFAFDAATGDLLWAWRERGGNLNGSIALSDRFVYVVDQRHLHAIDRASGTEAWSVEAGGRARFDPAVLAGDRLYATAAVPGDLALVVLDAATGAEHQRLPLATTHYRSQLAPGDRMIFVVHGSSLHAYR